MSGFRRMDEGGSRYSRSHCHALLDGLAPFGAETFELHITRNACFDWSRKRRHERKEKTMTARPTKWSNYREGDFVLRNYVFRSGETLPELRLHYRTLEPQGATPRARSSTACCYYNAIRHRRQLAASEPRRGAVRAGAAARSAAPNGVLHDPIRRSIS